MLQKKIILAGYPAGTRFMRQCMYSIFPEQYLTTIGVAVHRKALCVDELPVNLLVWELWLDGMFASVRPSYLRGMSGYVIVVDPDDEQTHEQAREFQQLARETSGDVPFLTCSIDRPGDAKDGQSKATASVHDSSSKALTLGATRRLMDDIFSHLAREILRYDKDSRIPGGNN